MKFLYESLLLLWDEKIRTFAATIQVMVFITALTISAGAYKTSTKYTTLYEQYNLNDKIYFSENMAFVESDSKENNLSVIFNYAESFQLISKNDETINCLCYRNDAFKNCVPQLYKGKYPNNKNDCIISYDLFRKLKCDVGDSVNLFDNDRNKYCMNISGVLSREALMISTSVSGSDLTLKAVFCEPDSSVIFFDFPEALNGHQPKVNKCRSGLAEVSCDSTLSEVKKAMINSDMSAFTFAEMEEYEREENKDIILSFVMLSVVLIVVGVVGIGVNNFLVLKVNKRKFGIYYTCGMSQTDCFLILILRNLITIAISSILSFFIVSLLRVIDYISELAVSNNYILIFTGFSAVILALSSVPLYFEIKRNDPIELFGGEN